MQGTHSSSMLSQSGGDCSKRDGGTTSQGKEPVTHGEGRRGFVTMGGVGFKGAFGVGCADSSTLSSVPCSTGGYASLHTFTSARTRAHTHARCSRNWLTRGGYPGVPSPFCPSFFLSLPLSPSLVFSLSVLPFSSPLPRHACT